MALEIERKFLVVSEDWRSAVRWAERYRQAYLARTPLSSIRVRRSDRSASLSVKSRRRGLVREEFEYPLSLEEADHLLAQLCTSQVVEKTRHFVEHAGMVWHVDEYAGQAQGLVTAEIELDRPDQPFVLPPWVGREVTRNARYRNWAIPSGAWRKARPRRARAPAATGLHPVAASPPSTRSLP